jgi:hypothetical protein
MLPCYAPIVNPADADIVTHHYVRQNPWSTGTYTLDHVLQSQKLHIPFAHSADYVAQFAANPLKVALPRESNLLMSLPVGTSLVCAGKKQAILVRLNGQTTAGHCSPLYITSEPKRFLTPYNQAEICVAMDQGLTLTPFYSLYRDIEVIGQIVNVPDWRCIAQMGSSGHCTTYFHRLLLEQE